MAVIAMALGGKAYLIFTGDVDAVLLLHRGGGQARERKLLDRDLEPVAGQCVAILESGVERPFVEGADDRVISDGPRVGDASADRRRQT